VDFSLTTKRIDNSPDPAIWLRSKGGLKILSINCRSIGPHGNAHKSPKSSIHRPREGAVRGAAPPIDDDKIRHFERFDIANANRAQALR
jgi:hypothetical protein